MSKLRARLFRQGITLEQFAFQFIVVLLGVYLAIFFEGKAEDRAEAADARRMLSDVLLEMRSDQREMEGVLTEQTGLLRDFGELEVLLRTASSADEPAIASLLEGPLANSSTAFPRRAAYSALVTSGRISAISSGELTLHLVNLYEHDYARLMNQGDLYDRSLTGAWAEVRDVRGWDFAGRRLIRRGPEANVVFRNAVRTHTTIAKAYVNRLTETLADLKTVEEDVRVFLNP